MPKPTTRFAVLVFLACVNWTYTALNIADHTDWAEPALAATSCTIFAIITRPRRAKN